MENNNILNFEMFDPVEAGEEWAITWGSNHKVVEIYVDGKKLLDIIREIEVPYANEEGYPELAGAYGHISPRELYVDLSTVLIDNSNTCDKRVNLFCCGSCGEIICWSVSFLVKEDERYVYWYDFRHEHRNWEYNLTYKFDKEEYEDTLWDLWDMSKEQKRNKPV